MAIYLSLSVAQLTELQRRIVANDPDLPTERLRIIELSAQGKGVPEIAGTIDMHDINVRKWIHRYERNGIAGLRTKKSPGRPLVFDTSKRTEIAELWKTKPRALGLTFSRWSLNRLRKYLHDTGAIECISVETIRQCIHAYA